MEEILKVSNLTKTFKLSNKQRKINKTDDVYKVAVNDLSFSAYKGEIFGLLGPNGAGKTTTLRVISTLIKADSGDVLVDGHSVKDESFKVRSKIGFLTSELKLEEFFTVDYMYDFYSSLHDVDEQTREQRKEVLYTKFGIHDFKYTKVGELSTGMKQKASLAVSLVHDPDIIIFDEPTNGLDVITAKMVTDFLLECKQNGKTVIVSTHIFSLIEKVCDRVGIIIEGKMILEDTLENITKEKSLEDKFFDLYLEVVGDK
jgi:sodium transport system ATP-binding protein